MVLGGWTGKVADGRPIGITTVFIESPRVNTDFKNWVASDFGTTLCYPATFLWCSA